MYLFPGAGPGNSKSARRRVHIARSPFDNSGNYPECSASIAPVPKKINPFSIKLQADFRDFFMLDNYHV